MPSRRKHIPNILNGRNYTHGIRALRLYTYVCKGASKRRILLCSLRDKFILNNPPTTGGVFFSNISIKIM